MVNDAIRIIMEPVTSSNLDAAGYDPQRKILAVQFKSGMIYHYAGVEPDLAFELYAAESKGRFYSAHIRGKFSAQRMTGPCAQCGDEGWIGDRCSACGAADYQAVPYVPKDKEQTS